MRVGVRRHRSPRGCSDAAMGRQIREGVPVSLTGAGVAPRRTGPPRRRPPSTLLKRQTAERRGLRAELARKLGVERAQMSRFKAGKEAFPSGKLSALHDLLEHYSAAKWHDGQ
jgi:transcriptional regulator with XRE-family HTH domain